MHKILLQGIQYDVKSSFQQGAALAPPLIRKALYSGAYNLYSEEGINIDNPKIQDQGDFNIKDYFEIEAITKNHLNQVDKIFTLGGDHSITYPIIKAYQQKYPELAILQIDAHSDLYHEFEGDPYSHACPFARIMESGLAIRLVQVGIRAGTPHQSEQAAKFGVEIHEMKNLDLSQIRQFDQPLYISLDLDGIDPAFAPGVSHHEPGGLTTRQVINLIHQIEADVVGADIVEYNPHRDHQDQTAYLAAKLMKELLAKMLL